MNLGENNKTAAITLLLSKFLCLYKSQTSLCQGLVTVWAFEVPSQLLDQSRSRCPGGWRDCLIPFLRY